MCDAAGRGIFHCSAPHGADRPGPEGAAEQDAEAILSTAFGLITEIPPQFISGLRGIGLTGQMHGVVQHNEAGQPRSPLVTWRDTRPSELRIGGCVIAPGRGWASLDRWARSGELTAPCCATIHGLLAARLCKLERAPIDPTDLHAWGGTEPPATVPASILPQRVGHGECIGHTQEVPGLPDGLPVAAPLGDNQASVRGTLEDFDLEAAFTIGTGCQLSIPVPQGHPPSGPGDHWEIRPFDGGRDLLVAAPRNGGLVWQWLAERICQWSLELGGPERTLEETYTLLDRLGAQAKSHLHFAPHLIGETWDARLTGCLSGLAPQCGSVGEIARAVARSIAENALNILPASALQGRSTLRASGNALHRSLLLRRESAEALGLPLTLSDFPEEAALGAARVASSGCHENAG